MAPDAVVPQVKSTGASSARLQRSVTPLSSNGNISVAISPIQKKDTSRPRRYRIPSGRVSDTSLSDQGDSEAETERLHITPQKQRPRMVVQHSNTTTATTAMAVEKPCAKEIISDQSGEIFSDISRSPTLRGLNKKRKRDDKESAICRAPSEHTEDKPAALSPPKKKHHLPTDSKEAGHVQAGIDQPDIDYISTNRRPKLTNSTESMLDNKTKFSSNISPADKTKGNRENIGVHPDSPLQDAAIEIPVVPPEDENVDVSEAVQEDEDMERTLKKKQAMDDLAEIERIFAKLKDSIYNEKLRRVEIEMKLLMEGTHPEYVAQKACVDQRLQEKIRLADAQYKYAMENLDTATHVSRAQIHSQYFQQTRQLREDTLYACSELWYNIQRERRSGDSLVPDYTFRIPDRQSTRIKQRMQYNWEVQILGAVQKHIGFPAAPNVTGATEEEKLGDFEELGISPRAPARNVPSMNVMRIDDQYELASSLNWPQAHNSPPSPVSHTTHTHPHIHRHHHHHHRPHVHVSQQGLPRQQDQYLFAQQQRRAPIASNLGSQQPSLSLSSLLHSSEANVKMESQLSQQPIRVIKVVEPFQNFPNQPSQRSPYHPINQNAHLFSRAENNDFSDETSLTSRHGVIDVEQISQTVDTRTTGKDFDVNAVRRLKDDMSSTVTSEGVGQTEFRSPSRGFA
ncbi:Sds3-like-domain-containing protein [Geopyxis carbonaria]|nr:Sds3-like-domain-containing protein [Geopyxis carbonaria]